MDYKNGLSLTPADEIPLRILNGVDYLIQS